LIISLFEKFKEIAVQIMIKSRRWNPVWQSATYDGKRKRSNSWCQKNAYCCWVVQGKAAKLIWRVNPFLQ